ncbi:MAG: serine hydrolase domain-containing protein [Bacteroidota bacterium]
MTLQTPKRLALTCIFLISFLFTVHAQTAIAEKSALQEVGAAEMQGFIDAGKYPGISTLIIQDGKEVQQNLFGHADLENTEKMDRSTIVRIFSMTKPVTAMAMMQLLEEGKFTLDDKVSDFIPAFAETKVYAEKDGEISMEEQATPMTIRHLLTHTSGITYGWDPKHYVDSMYRVSGLSGWGDGTLEEKINILAKMPLKHQPGTKWEYGLSIDIAGYIVEKLSGKSLGEYCEVNIFEPLGMDDSGFYVSEDKADRLAGMYARDEEGKLQNTAAQWGNSFLEKPSIHYGGAGMVSTLDDYAKFCQTLLNGGQLDGIRVLKESSVKTIMSNQLPEGVVYHPMFDYGLSGQVNKETGEYHWSGAASTSFFVHPGSNRIIVTFSQVFPSDQTYWRTFKGILDNAMAEK